MNRDSNNKPILIANNIEYSYKENKYLENKILDKVSIEISKGESIAIIGQSGTGKSTLLHVLGSVDLPKSGSLIIDGIDIYKSSQYKRNILRNKYIGFIYQQHHLLPEFSALENVMMPLMISKDIKGDFKNKALGILNKVGLKDKCNSYPSELSGGERQRVSIARAMVNDPKIVLADEPTGSLDEKTASEIISLLLRLQREEGTALIVVTHDNSLADRLDRIYRLQFKNFVQIK